MNIQTVEHPETGEDFEVDLDDTITFMEAVERLEGGVYIVQEHSVGMEPRILSATDFHKYRTLKLTPTNTLRTLQDEYISMDDVFCAYVVETQDSLWGRREREVARAEAQVKEAEKNAERAREVHEKLRKKNGQ